MIKYMHRTRFFDIILSILLLILTFPILILTSLLILIFSGWPILYVSERIGKDKKPFKIYKFRTMVLNADKQKQRLFIKDTQDIRITKIGKILRKTSIDELPQLLNVLKGDMSLVGPRPYLKQEADVLNPDRFKVLPGITGPVQIIRNPNITVEEINKIEATYLSNLSIKQYFLILIKTIKTVFKGI